MSIAISPKAYARIAGGLYLIIAVFGVFAIAYVPSVIIVVGDGAATSAKLLANQGLFGMGVFADIVVMLSEIALSVMLFVLFRPVSPTLSLVALVSRLTMVAVMTVNLLIYVMPLVQLRGAGATEAVQDTAMALFEAHKYGIYVWDMFFGFHLGVLGYLIFRSGYFPRLLGLALMVGGPGYFLEGLTKVAFLDNTTLGMVVVGLLALTSLSELAFAFWLLIKGINVAAWNNASQRPTAA